MIPLIVSDWCSKYDVSIDLISYSEQDLGLTTAGKCLFYHNPPGRSEIIINSRLGDNIGKEETLWHEFCHAWEWQKYGTHGHGERFKELYSNRSYPWYAGLIQCIDMIIGEFIKRGRLPP